MNAGTDVVTAEPARCSFFNPYTLLAAGEDRQMRFGSMATAYFLVGSGRAAQTTPCEGSLVNQQRCGCADDQVSSYEVYPADSYDSIYVPPASEVHSSPKLVKGSVPDSCLARCRIDPCRCDTSPGSESGNEE